MEGIIVFSAVGGKCSISLVLWSAALGLIDISLYLNILILVNND